MPLQSKPLASLRCLLRSTATALAVGALLAQPLAAREGVDVGGISPMAKLVPAETV